MNPQNEESTSTQKQDSTVIDSVKMSLRHKLHVLCIFLGFSNYGVLTSSVSAYIADIIVDIGIVQRKTDTGYFTGYPVMIFCFSCSVTTLFWSLLSDRIGRKQVLIVSQIAQFSCIFLLAFISTSSYFGYVYIILIHILRGTFAGGLIPVIKASLGEISPKKSLPFVFALFLGSYPMGSVIGSLISGVFSRPTHQYPQLFYPPGSAPFWEFAQFLEKYPVILTHLILAVYSGAVSIIFVFGMVETKGFNVVEMEVENMRSSLNEEYLSKILPAGDNKDTQEKSKSNEEKEEGTVVEVKLGKLARLRKFFQNEIFSRSPILSNLAYFLLGFTDFLFGRVVPVFFSLPVEDKGIGFSNLEIGIAQVIIGLVRMNIQVFRISPWLVQKFSPVWVSRIAPLLLIPIAPLLPELSYLLHNDAVYLRVILWVLLVIYIVVVYGGLSTIYTSLGVCVNNSVTVKNRSTVQGMGFTLVSIGKGLGPIVGSLLLSIGSNINVFPFDIHFFFIVGCFGALLISVFSFFIPRDLKHSREYVMTQKELKDNEVVVENEEENVGKDDQLVHTEEEGKMEEETKIISQKLEDVEKCK